jgi:4-amino-4-deoxy-L-arabinose transferase-like glycosyltransferase
MVCVLLVGYALRVAGLAAESLWIDEGYSMALAGRSLPDVVRGAAASQHPPFYYILLAAWLSVGRSVFHLRYLSALLGTLGVASGAWMGRELLGRRVGLLTGLLLACSPTHVWYSQEARMYVLLALLVTISAALAWRILCHGRGWLWWGISTSLALYTHYFSVFVILAENLYVLAWMARQPALKRRWLSVRWLGMQAAVAFAFAPWLPVTVNQVGSHQMGWMEPLSWARVGGTPILLVMGEAGLGPLGALVLAGLGLAVVLFLWREWRAGRCDTLWSFGFALAWFAVPYGTMTLVSLAYPIFQSKQTLMLLTPLLVMLSVSWVRLPRLAQVALGLAVAWAVAGSLTAMYRVETKDGWRELATYIQERYQAGDVLYSNPAAGRLTLEAYLTRALEHDGYPPDYDVVTGGWAGEPVTEAIAEREMAALATAYQRVWLVEFGPEFWDPQGYLADWLDRHGHRAVQQSFGRVDVRLYDLARQP